MLWILIRSALARPSNEYPQHMFSSRNKKNIMWIPPLICSHAFFQPKSNDIFLILERKCMLWYSFESPCQGILMNAHNIGYQVYPVPSRPYTNAVQDGKMALVP